jgi:hypothetical protein
MAMLLRIWLAMGGLAAALAWVIAGSQPFKSCVEAEYSTNAGYAASQGIEPILAALEIRSSCGAAYLGSTDGIALISAFATVAIAFFAVVLAHAGRAADRNFRQAQRAYVQISHEGPLRLTPDVGGAALRMQIKNWGVTPATITASIVQIDVRRAGEALPRIPPYRPAIARGTFLVTQATMHWLEPFQAGDQIDVGAAIRGDIIVRVIGYVEYIDRFGARHHGRYARIYDPERDRRLIGQTDAEFANRNNLVFELQPGYNDDIPMGRVV